MNHEIVILPNVFYDTFKEYFRDLTISFNEACPHWIDYDIYELLPDNLRKDYVNQFKIPSVIFRPFDKKVMVECKMNPKEFPYKIKSECSRFYPNSTKLFLESFCEMKCFSD